MLDNLTNIYQSNPKEFHRFVKFSIVGATGAVIDFTLLNLMRGFFGWDILWANTLSVSVAIVSNFTWNRYWTYPDSRSKPVVQQFIQFFVVNALGIVIRLPIIALTRNVFARLMESLFSSDPATAETLGNNLALAVAVVIVMFWNFFINRFWTYSDVGSWGESTSPEGANGSTPSGSAATQESK